MTLRLNAETESAFQDVAALPFSAKQSWLEQQLKRRRTPWEEGHIDILVSRDSILEEHEHHYPQNQQISKINPDTQSQDSFNLCSSLTSEDFRKDFKYIFDGETDVSQDAGGMGREWFQELCTRLFDPQLALFKFTETDHGCYQVYMRT